MPQTFNRRHFLLGTGLAGLGVGAAAVAAPLLAQAAATRITIVSNPGLENATLGALMQQQGYFKKFGVDAALVEARGAKGPFNAITAGAADVCMASGYDRVLSRIEQGAKIKLVGAGMRKSALTVFARHAGIRSVSDLKGKIVAVGPKMGLLHALMLQLMKEKGVDASQVRFVDKGSNDQCHEAAVRGEADACCSSISHLNDNDGLVVIDEANMWQALPEYTFQTAYASDTAILQKHEALVAVMAAYGSLYEYLMSPAAHDAFFEARRNAQKKFDARSAQAVWNFNQVQRPYSRDLALTANEIGYLQDIDLGLGMLKRKQSVAEVADMSAATAAAALSRDRI